MQVKIGTSPGEVVLVKAPKRQLSAEGTLKVGSVVQYKRTGGGERWQGARVWMLSSDRVYLEMW